MLDAGENVLIDYEGDTSRTELVRRKPSLGFVDEFGSPEERRRLEVRVYLAVTPQASRDGDFLLIQRKLLWKIDLQELRRCGRDAGGDGFSVETDRRPVERARG